MRTAIILCVVGTLAACAGRSGGTRPFVSDDCTEVAQRRAAVPSQTWAYTARLREEYDRCLAGRGAEPSTPPTTYRIY